MNNIQSTSNKTSPWFLALIMVLGIFIFQGYGYAGRAYPQAPIHTELRITTLSTTSKAAVAYNKFLVDSNKDHSSFVNTGRENRNELLSYAVRIQIKSRTYSQKHVSSKKSVLALYTPRKSTSKASVILLG